MTTTIESRDFREYAYNLSPPYLRFEWGGKLVGVFGLMADTVAEGTQQGVIARFLLSPIHPDDALDKIASERLLPRYPSESDATHRTRLVKAWEAWQRAGSITGIVDRFEEWGPDAETKGNHQWNWDGDDYWSRFWVILTNTGWSFDVWGPTGTWGDGGVWGVSDMTYEESQTIRRIVRDWKPANEICAGVILVLNPAAWTGTPTGDWDVWENRDTGAIYFEGF